MPPISLQAVGSGQERGYHDYLLQRTDTALQCCLPGTRKPLGFSTNQRLPRARGG